MRQEGISRWIVAPEEAHERLDHYLARQIPEQSRSQIQRWIREGQVQVNGTGVKTGYLLRSGDELTIERESELPPELRPEALPLTVLYQDEDLAVIDKPAGMASHLGAGVRSGTLVNALLYHFENLEGGDPKRPGIVHRLDKQTSGVMVVAKTGRAHQALAQQFKKREVKKEYLALVYGRPRPPSGTIDLPLGRDPRNRKRFSTRARRHRPAVTHYTVEALYGPLSLLRVRIETGRTHQIRVHLAHKGHPVVGDTLYGGDRSKSLPKKSWQMATKQLERFFLHACSLEFRHPRTGAVLAFTAPLPPELESLLALLIADCGLKKRQMPRPIAGLQI